MMGKGVMSVLDDDNLLTAVGEGAEKLRGFLAGSRPVAGIILGSGLNSFADALEEVRVLDYRDVPFMESSTATGHRGRFVLGTVAGTGKRVLCMQGRLHKYEGYLAKQVAFPVWIMAECGIDTLITTNAAGAINPSFQVGDFCIMSDQINFTGRNPLIGRAPNAMAERFVPMLDCFDPKLRALAHEVADREQVRVQDGVYLGLLGPSFETPAEIRMFARWGADTVAMSVVEEVIAARHRGMRVLGMSLVSNMACGVQGSDPNSDEIMDVAAAREGDFSRLMGGIVDGL